MTKNSYFYREITRITENRIKELMRHAEEIEAREHAFPKVISNFRAHAITVYLAWLDVTNEFHTKDDRERLKALANGTALID